ncbi:hypothetical protein, partial [Escherichia coli]|uniref:hypothetical protein n=1 Tax=Escherichia coli TaxID=562 RepID=UPI001A7EB340
IFSHPVYLFLREFSLQDSRGGSELGPWLNQSFFWDLPTQLHFSSYHPPKGVCATLSFLI